jgi:hypothetical protein
MKRIVSQLSPNSSTSDHAAVKPHSRNKTSSRRPLFGAEVRPVARAYPSSSTHFPSCLGSANRKNQLPAANCSSREQGPDGSLKARVQTCAGFSGKSHVFPHEPFAVKSKPLHRRFLEIRKLLKDPSEALLP